MVSTRLRIDDWDESVIEELADGSKVTRAQVRLRDGTAWSPVRRACWPTTGLTGRART